MYLRCCDKGIYSNLVSMFNPLTQVTERSGVKLEPVWKILRCGDSASILSIHRRPCAALMYSKDVLHTFGCFSELRLAS
jgi:hypothetical protein